MGKPFCWERIPFSFFSQAKSQGFPGVRCAFGSLSFVSLHLARKFRVPLLSDMVVKRAEKDVKRKLQMNVSRVTSEDKGEDTDCDIAMCEAFDKEKEQPRKENASLKARLNRLEDQLAALTKAVQRLSG